MKKTIIAIAVCLGMSSAYADNIDVSHQTNWETDFHVNNLQSIEMWNQPKMPATPKNLVSEQQMRFSGHTGNDYQSYTLHISDYDTYITKTEIVDGKYVATNNIGQTYVTGEVSTGGEDTNTVTTVSGSDAVSVSDSGSDGNHAYKIDLSNDTKQTLNQVNVNKTNIENNKKEISSINTIVKTHDESINNLNNLYIDNSNQIAQNSREIDNLGKKVDWMNRKIDDLRDDMYDMGASMSALAGIHYQKMNEHESQLAMAVGQYKGRQAVALGLSHQINDRIQIHASGTAGRESMFNIGGSIKF